MRIINSKQQISDANASGRRYSSAPWNIFSNSFNNSKEVQNINGGQNGRSMIEMLGVLAIIGVLSVGGIAGYSKAMQKYRINKTIEQITLIAGNVRTFFAPQGNYAGLNARGNDGLSIIKKAKLVPDEMWDGNTIKDVWGNLLFIRAMDRFNQGDRKAFAIGFDELSQEVCIELGAKNWNEIENTMVVSVGSEGRGPVDNEPEIQLRFAGENCSGLDSDTPLIGCLNGNIIPIPMPLEKIVDACTIKNNTALDLYIVFK